MVPGNQDRSTGESNPLAEPLLPQATDQRRTNPIPTSDETEAPIPLSKRNITLTLWYTTLAFVGRSLWSQSVLSGYVFLIRSDDPEAVGLITAVMGIAQLVASFPAGYCADKLMRRDTLLKIAVVTGLIALLITLFAIHTHDYVWLTGALSVWGVFWGMSDPAIGALFADSMVDGERSKYFTQRSLLTKLGNTVGPIVAFVCFYGLGNEWTISETSIVMVVGQALCFPAICVLCFLNDDYCTSSSSPLLNGDNQEDPPNVHTNGMNNHDENDDRSLIVSGEEDDDHENCERETFADEEHASSYEQFLLSNSTNDIANQPCPSNGEVAGSGADIDNPPHSRSGIFCLPEHRVIPIFVATGDVFMGLAAGMSIRYFPIFFMDSLHLNPVIVQLMYILSPLAQAVLMYLAQIWAKRVGRCLMTCILKWIGIAFMIAMIGSYERGWNPWIILTFYLFRTTFMNSTSALTKSMLMDNVPPSERSRWTALESVNMFSWSGSAAIGGLLAGWKGIIFNFCVTASLQFLATLPLVALFSRDEGEGDHENRRAPH